MGLPECTHTAWDRDAAGVGARWDCALCVDARIAELERFYTAACRRVAMSMLSVRDEETVAWAVAEIKRAIERTGN